MIRRCVFVGLLVCYSIIIVPFTDYLKNRPVEIKLGHLPSPQLIKTISGEHRSTYSAFAVMRILFYYGTIIQKFQENVIVRPEFMNMYKILEGAVYIDPYNMDAYYFCQAAFTWELGRVREVNALLERGMKYRTWDYWLPFYLGFNNAYFLKDYQKAAIYLKRAAEISGNPLFTNLASRYFFESEETDFGLAFLDTMIKSAKSPAVRKSYEMRRDALLAVKQIDAALKIFKEKFGSMPTELNQLTRLGILKSLPPDPYGGQFYLDQQGKVRSSSKFVNHPIKKKRAGLNEAD